MFSADAKTMQRVAAQIQRVLIVEHVLGASKLLAELMKEMGAREVKIVTRSDHALDLLRDFSAQIVFTEYAAPQLDGLEMTEKLRRSTFVSRKAPVIMVTAEATQGSIIAARNAGVHEFLRKPYTAGDLFRRVENVTTKPRQWIEAAAYVGPDRRRFNSGEFAGARKRRSDTFHPPDAARAS